MWLVDSGTNEGMSCPHLDASLVKFMSLLVSYGYLSNQEIDSSSVPHPLSVSHK